MRRPTGERRTDLRQFAFFDPVIGISNVLTGREANIGVAATAQAQKSRNEGQSLNSFLR
jgi:hypothetical protein